MKPLHQPTLVGRYVRLEPLDETHAAALLDAANASRATYPLTNVPADPASMDAYIAFALAEAASGQAMPFVVRDAHGAVVGSTRFMALEWWAWGGMPVLERVPAGPDALEIGATWYAERVQRTEVNTEAKLLLCTHAFEVWRVRRVTWKTDARNRRSRNAILRLGARFDGILRAHRVGYDGAIRDSAYYSMLASEWPSARQALTRRLERGLPEVDPH